MGDGDYGIFDCLEMRFIVLKRLFRSDTARSPNMSIGNKSFDGKMGRAKIFWIMNFYINTNKVLYNDDVVGIYINISNSGYVTCTN